MEHIAPQVRPPWWTLKARTKISPLNKKEAAQAHKQHLRQIPTQDLVIYTDSSGHDGHVGTAIYSPTLNMMINEYISIKDTHNVYAAELMAIQMAVSLFKKRIEEYSNVHIFTDNQSAIQTIESPKRQSGQYIIKGILNIIDRVYAVKPTCNVHIEWIPGHQNIDGNERADQAAKAAANPNNIIPSTRMKSPQKTAIRTAIKIQGETEWKTGRNTTKHL